MMVLVVGATGSVGRHTTAALLARGADVRALVRTEERAATLPAAVTPALGDLHDEASVTAALTGVTAALYTTPHDPGEERLAETPRAYADYVRDTAAEWAASGR